MVVKNGLLAYVFLPLNNEHVASKETRKNYERH